MDQTCPLFVYFRPFSLTIINIVQLTINEKECRWSTWDSNPGPQNGWRRPSLAPFATGQR